MAERANITNSIFFHSKMEIQYFQGLRPTRRAKNTVTATTRNSEQKQRNEAASSRYERRNEDDGLTAAEKWTRMMAIQYKYNSWMGVETGRDALAEEGNYTTTGFEDEIEYENVRGFS